MQKFNLLFVFLFLFSVSAFAQLKVGSNPTNINANAIFEMESVGKGMLLPRVNLSTAVFATPPAGLVVYNTSGTTPYTPGIYYHDGTNWVRLTTSVLSDATTTAKGILQLAGDLTGTAALPAIANNAVTSAKILDATIATADLADGAVTAAKLNQMSATAGQVIKWNGTAWAPAADAAGTAFTGSTSVVLNGTSFERAAFTGDVTATQNTNALTIAANAVTSAKIADATIVTADLADASVTNAKIVANTIDSTRIAPRSILTSELADGAVTAAKLNAMGATAAGQVIKWNGTAWAPAADAAGTAFTGSTSVVLNGTSFERAAFTGDVTATQNTNALTIAANAVTSAKIADATIVTADLADASVTNAKIVANTIDSTRIAPRSILTSELADGAVTAAKLNAMGATAAGQVIKWNGTAWAPAADAAGTAFTGSTSVVLNGTSFERAAFTGDVTATQNTNALTIAANAVTSAKILDGTIAAADLADGAVTSVKILDATIATADLADATVTSAKIADATIATADLADGAVTAAKLNAMGATTAGQVIKWDGTTWAPAADAFANTAVSTKTAAYTLAATDGTIFCDASTAAFTLTIPAAAAGNAGTVYVIRKVDDSSNVLTFSTSIRTNKTGATWNTINTLNYPATIRIQSDGAAWYLID